MLPRSDDNFGDAGLTGFVEYFAKQRVGPAAIFERFQVVRLVVINRANLRGVDKIGYRDGLRCLDISLGKLVVGERDVLALFILVGFDNLVPRHFTVGFLIYPSITDTGEVS